jgi:hypothetical protein
MTTAFKILVLPLILLMITDVSTFADQRHVVSPTELAAAVAQGVASQDADRAAVREALARPEIRNAAEAIGVNLDQVAAAAETLKGSDLEQAAAAARQINQQYVGGASTIVISTTTLIIGLLVLILLIVALK